MCAAVSGNVRALDKVHVLERLCHGAGRSRSPRSLRSSACYARYHGRTWLGIALAFPLTHIAAGFHILEETA